MLPQKVKATRTKRVAKDLLVAPGSSCVKWECWTYEAQ